MDVFDGCWQNEDRNPNIGFSREHKPCHGFPSKARVICFEKEKSEDDWVTQLPGVCHQSGNNISITMM